MFWPFWHTLRSCRRIGFSPGLRSYVSHIRQSSLSYRRNVLTLRPEMLAKVQQKVFDLSNVKRPNFRIVNSTLATVCYSRGPSLAYVPFPENTRGVLYFYRPPHKPESYGELRFRLCDTIDAFHDGHDLKNEHGDVWCVTQILKRHSLGGWRQLVINENLAHPHEASQLPKLYTLRPEKMAEVGQEALLLADRSVCTVYFQDPNHQLHVTYTAFRRTAFRRTAFRRTAFRRYDFPPDARGVLYYYQDSNLPAIAGQVRFRICESPAQFSEGRDLLTPDGEYWHLSLYRLARKVKAFEMYKGIRELLLREGLVDTGLLNDIEQLPTAGAIFPDSHLYALHQPFKINLAHTSRVIYVLTRHTKDVVCLPGYFVDYREHTNTRPYTGKILARLEILPESRGKEPKIALRVLEILEPITCVIEGYDGHIPPPVVGDLVHRYNWRRSKYCPMVTKKKALQRLALAEASGS